MANKYDNSVQAVDRAFLILEELAKEKNGCGVTQLSNLTGLHKSTVHRLLTTLMINDYVSKDTERDKYSLGMKILFLASSILDRIDVRTVARPYIEALSKATKEVVHLAILDNGEAVYIDKVENPDKSIRMYSQIGKRVPLHCTAVGKILLAWLSEEEAESILKLKGMKPCTKNTITNIDIMLEHLKQIRKMGYALDEIEHEEEIRCIAAPIFNIKGKVAAAISISGPILHITKKRIPELEKQITKTAETISYQLGHIK